MQIPQEIKILGITYKVNQVDHIPGLRLGQIDFVSGEIQLLINSSESVKEHTFIHEITHGMCKAIAFDYSDEDLVQQLATAIYSLIQDNKSFFSSL